MFWTAILAFGLAVSFIKLGAASAAQLFFCKNFRAMPSGWMSQSSRLR